MSASVEIFDVLRLQAYAYVGRVHRKTGAPVTEEAMRAFLGRAVPRYVAGGGVGDLTEAVITDTCRSITAFCVAMPVRVQSAARKRLFDAMAPRAKAWAMADRRARRAPVNLVGLRAYVEGEATAFCAVPGQECGDDEREAVVAALTEYFGRMKAVRPAVVRPNRTASGMRETSCQVQLALNDEQREAEEQGREPVRLSIDALLTRLQTERVVLEGGRTSEGLPGVTRSSVRGAVERLSGQPRRAAAIDRLPPTARDLAGALEAELPLGHVSVVETVALAGKLWAPARTAEGRRQHVRRLRVAAAAIENAGIGLHVAVVGSHVVVGRGRTLPKAEELQGVVDRALSPRRGRKGVYVLSRGLVPSRQGLWGTDEGEIAKSVCRVAASQAGHDDVWIALAAVGQIGAAEDFSTVWDRAGETVQHDTLVLADAVLQAFASQTYGRLTEQAPTGVELVRTIVTRARDGGLDQAWALYASRGDMAERLRRPGHSGARERIRRIGAALSKAPTPEAWEAAILLDAFSVRPGRRHLYPVVAMPRPPKTVAAPVPAPAPKAEFFPTPVKDAMLSVEMADEIKAHWRCNKMQPAMQALRAVFMGYDIEEAKAFDLDELPVPSSVEQVLEGLRRVLRWWKSPELALVARLDQDLDGVLRRSIVNAGIALREHGWDAFVTAGAIVPAIASAARSVDGVRALPRRLLQGEERMRWLIEQKASKAA